MPTKETRVGRGKRRAEAVVSRTTTELRDRRLFLGASQAAVARELGITQPHLWRLEAAKVPGVSVKRLSELASVLGMELFVGVYELGDPLRDRGQQALGRRFDAIVAPAWQVTVETPLPLPGDRRSWDRLLRLLGDESQLVGADLETRIRDIQALVRRTRERERDGGADAILLVLSDSATSRLLVPQLREALGKRYSTMPRAILAALREGRRLPGSGVILL